MPTRRPFPMTAAIQMMGMSSRRMPDRRSAIRHRVFTPRVCGVLPGRAAQRWRRIKFLISIAAAIGCALVVALVVVAAGRQPVLVTTAAVTPVSSSTVELGVITSGDATVAKKPDLAFISVGVESQQSTARSEEHTSEL